MRVRFWGTRGSFPKPGPKTLRYGGNTSCVEVRGSDGTLIVIDCGTGAHDLGRLLVASEDGPRHGHLLLGHTHWDHIQGFPFFGPLFDDGFEWEIYAPGGRGRDIEAVLAGQMAYEYFPINLEGLNASVRLHDLTEGVFEIGNIRVTTHYMNHPALTLGFRLEADGATLVYASDHEPHSLHPRGVPPGTVPIHHEDRRHVEFLQGADLLIHDAQYTLDEFPEKEGWGHAPVERVVDYAILGRVRQLALYHHDPDRTDDAIDQIVEMAQGRARDAEHTPRIFGAAEGLTLDLIGERAETRASAGPSALLSASSRRASTVLVVDDDPDMVRLLEETLHTEGVRVLAVPDGESALVAARDARPALILLDMKLPGLDGLTVCKTLRADPDPRLRTIPILILTGHKLKDTDLVEAFGAGATDYLIKPIKPTLVRSRVRRWLHRTA